MFFIVSFYDRDLLLPFIQLNFPRFIFFFRVSHWDPYSLNSNLLFWFLAGWFVRDRVSIDTKIELFLDAEDLSQVLIIKSLWHVFYPHTQFFQWNSFSESRLLSWLNLLFTFHFNWFILQPVSTFLLDKWFEDFLWVFSHILTSFFSYFFLIHLSWLKVKK